MGYRRSLTVCFRPWVRFESYPLLIPITRYFHFHQTVVKSEGISTLKGSLGLILGKSSVMRVSILLTPPPPLGLSSHWLNFFVLRVSTTYLFSPLPSYFRLISATTTESPWCPSVFHQLFWCHTFLSQSRELCLHYVRHPIFLCVVKLCCLHRKWASDTGNTSGIPYCTCSCVVNSLYTAQCRMSLNFVQE